MSDYDTDILLWSERQADLLHGGGRRSVLPCGSTAGATAMAATDTELAMVAALFGLARCRIPGAICLRVECADGETRSFTGVEAGVAWWAPGELPLPLPCAAG